MENPLINNIEDLYRNSVGDKIHKHLLKHQSNLRDIASELDLALSTIFRLTSDKPSARKVNITLTTLLKISLGLDIPTEALLDKNSFALKIDQFDSLEKLNDNTPSSKSYAVVSNKYFIYQSDSIFKLKFNDHLTAHFIKLISPEIDNNCAILYKNRDSIDFGFIKIIDGKKYFSSSFTPFQVEYDSANFYASMMNPEHIRTSSLHKLIKP